MTKEGESALRQSWRPAQVYALATICLLVGVALGYLFRGTESHSIPAQAASETAPSTAGPVGMASKMPSLDDMKRMADKQAEPLLAKLKADPNNSQLLNQIGTVYKATHRFQDAARYFQRAVDADPKNTGARTDLASCLYYQGDADGAISQLQQSLRDNPGDANSLFNLGMIRLQAKHDSTGAVNAWQELLKLNPKLPDEKKSEVRKLIAQARNQNQGK